MKQKIGPRELALQAQREAAAAGMPKLKAPKAPPRKGPRQRRK